MRGGRQGQLGTKRHRPCLQSVWPPVSEWERLGGQAASEVLLCWRGAGEGWPLGGELTFLNYSHLDSDAILNM